MKPVLYGPDNKPITNKPADVGFIARIDGLKMPKTKENVERK